MFDGGECTAVVEGGGEGPREDGGGESRRSSHDGEQKGEICEEERRFMRVFCLYFLRFLFQEMWVFRFVGMMGLLAVTQSCSVRFG